MIWGYPYFWKHPYEAVFERKYRDDTLLNTNIAPENGHSQKERIVSQPSIYRGELLVLEMVILIHDRFAVFFVAF